MGDLRAYQLGLSASVELLLSGSRELGCDVTRTSRSLHGLIDRAKTLRALSSELCAIQRRAQAEAQGAKPPEGRHPPENKRYTMEEERRVQKAALAPTAPATHEEIAKPADGSSTEGSIEFF